MFLIQVLTKFLCPTLKTFVLAAFLNNHIKLLKKPGEVLEEPYGIPAEEAAGHH
jgi:hypothetical protein